MTTLSRLLLILLFFYGANSFAQNLKDNNFRLIFIKDSCKSKFFFNRDFFDKPNPFAPSINDFNIGFGILDSSIVKIDIFYANNGSIIKLDTIIKIDTLLTKGCYSLEWAYQNLDKLETGDVYYSIEAVEKKTNIVSTFNRKKKISIIK